MATYSTKQSDIERKWYLVDAADKRLGRLASQVARLLMGKHKPYYAPHLDTGDHVIVINARKLSFTEKRLRQKIYYRHSGYPGGLKATSAGQLMATKPERVIMLAVKGMLPKNRLGRKMLKKLRVYPDGQHPHESQKPEPVTIG